LALSFTVSLLYKGDGKNKEEASPETWVYRMPMFVEQAAHVKKG
jgi:hypothetical protein